MRKRIIGYLFNRLEEMGKEKFNHIGFEGEKESFGEMMAAIVPEIGMRKKARLTIELLADNSKKINKKVNY
jgi:hypothetical protein